VAHVIVLINLLYRHFKECPDGIYDNKIKIGSVLRLYYVAL